MNRNNIYNYIKLCKRSNISDIKQIASDPDIILDPESLVSKYNVSLNEIDGILEVKKFGHYLDCDDALEYIHEKYIARGGKGGVKKGPKGPKQDKSKKQKAVPGSKKGEKKKAKKAEKQQVKKEQKGMTKQQKKENSQKRREQKKEEGLKRKQESEEKRRQGKKKKEDSEEDSGDDESDRSSLSDTEKRHFRRNKSGASGSESDTSVSDSEPDDSTSSKSEGRKKPHTPPAKPHTPSKLRDAIDTGSNRIMDNLIKQIQEMNKKMTSIEKVSTQTKQMMHDTVESISEQADRIESVLSDDGTEKPVQEGGKCKCSCRKKKSFDDYKFTSDEETVIEKCG